MSKPQDFERWIAETATQINEESVPEWPRESTYRPRYTEQSKHSVWWQKPWLPIGSLAVSLFAMVLVLGQVQVSSSEHGFSVQFGGVDEAKLEAMVAQRLNEYGAQQQLTLANYATNLRADFREDFRTEMAQANKQLADYMLAVNRQEREGDLAELIRYVNEQRQDDQYYFASQFQQFSDGWIQPAVSTSQ